MATSFGLETHNVSELCVEEDGLRASLSNMFYAH